MRVFDLLSEINHIINTSFPTILTINHFDLNQNTSPAKMLIFKEKINALAFITNFAQIHCM